MSLLEIIVSKLRVKALPELIVEYLAKDDCLDDQTINIVFRTVYTNEYGYTYMDESKTVLHSFDDEPALIWGLNRDTTKREWYRNGRLYRINSRPVIAVCKVEDDEKDECFRFINIYVNNNNTLYVKEWIESDTVIFEPESRHNWVNVAFENFIIGKDYSEYPLTMADFNDLAQSWSKTLQAGTFKVTETVHANELIDRIIETFYKVL
jgi:hypothetical protein